MTNRELDLRGLARGNLEAWRVAFQVLYPVAFKAASHSRLGLAPVDAEDAAAEALRDLVGLIKKQCPKDEGNLRALTAALGYRKAVSLLRARTAAKRGGGQAESLEALEEKLGEAGSVAIAPAEEGFELLDAEDLAMISSSLRNAIESLGEKLGPLVEDFYYKNLTYQEIADKRGLPMGTVSVYLSRALVRIRKILERDQEEVKQLRDFLR